jgi:hypothetical protein
VNLAIRAPGYEHTQRGPLGYLLALIALAFAASAIFVPHLVVGLVHGGVALLVFAAAFCFGRLTVRDEGEHLAVRYGPLAVFRKSLRYADITAVERGRSALIDGWGIHWIPGRGTTYNLWGFDCVKLTVNGKTIRVGTDDADELARHIKERLGTGISPRPSNPT